MKLELADVQDRVARTDDARAEQIENMKAWQKMFDLDAGFSQTWDEAIKTDGREQVTSSDPYNVVGLAMRLIPSQPKIDVPPRDETNEAEEDAEQIERWLTVMYQIINKQQGSNFVEDLKMQLFKLGLGYVEAKWIDDDRPKSLRNKRFPILIRTLNPFNVGFHRGPLDVDYAYHKYEDEKINVRQRYPNLKQWEDPKPKKKDRVKTEGDMVTVVDFWYMAPDTGRIWNCILVNDEFAKEPVETDYPIVPIIEVRGEGDGKSILHSINGLWQYQCRLLSNIGTAVLWTAWPFFSVTNETNAIVDDITVRPGATVSPPWGTKFEQIKPDVNLNVITAMLDKTEAKISQATFPGVLYGDAGGMQAGYGVNILSQAASGRVNSARESLEMALQWLNVLILALVEEMGDAKNGVEIWGRDEGSEKLYKTCLYPKQIDGYYENAVQLKLNLPTDDQQKQTFGFQLAQGGKDHQPAISMQTFRDKYLAITVPTDEQDRIDAERAAQHPAIQEKLAVLNYMKIYPETWEVILQGTPLIDIAYKMAEATVPETEWSDGLTAWKRKQMEPQAPPLPFPGGMAPPGMPPPIGGPMGGTPSQAPAMLAGPMGGGVPPQMQGQMTPLDVGLPYHGSAPQFADMMGNPLSPNEQLQALGGQMPPMGA